MFLSWVKWEAIPPSPEFPEPCDMSLAGSLETGEFGSCPRANGNKTPVLLHHRRVTETTYKIVRMLLYPFNCPEERRQQKQFKILHRFYWGYEVSWTGVEMFIRFNITPPPPLPERGWITRWHAGQRKLLAESSVSHNKPRRGTGIVTLRDTARPCC